MTIRATCGKREKNTSGVDSARMIRLLGDCAYGGKSVSRHLRENTDADMHQTARYALLRDILFANPNKNRGKPKLTDHAENILRLAA